MSALGRASRALAAGVTLAAALAPQPAIADWKAAVGKLRIGIVAKPGAGAMVAGVASLERAYARALGLPVAVFVARDFPALIDAQASGRVDYAVYSATAYVVAARFCDCVVPIAAPVARDGATGTKAVLITRAEVRPGAEAPRIAVPGSGELPLALMSSRLAAAPASAATERPWIPVPVADAQEAERRFLAGELDGFLGWASARDGGADAVDGGSVDRLALHGMAAGDYVVAWTSQPMRFGPHAIRADAPAELRRALERFLVNLRETDTDAYDVLEEERQGGFAPVVAGDYEALAALIAELAEDGPPAP